MNEILDFIKELTRPLLQHKGGITVLFIYFVTAMAIPHVVAPLVTAHPIAGFVLFTLVAYGEGKIITRISREWDSEQ